MNHLNEERLNDYVDGELSAAELAAVESHLASCLACKQEAEALRSLVQEASGLGKQLPRRDLFSAVRDEVSETTPVGTKLPIARWVGIAASILLVGWVGLQSWQGSRTEGPTADASIESLLERFQAAEKEYREATELLVARLDERRDELPPETLAILDRNLAIVDAAIAELVNERAQEADGSTDMVDQKMLTTLYDKKLQLLWQASRLSS